MDQASRTQEARYSATPRPPAHSRLSLKLHLVTGTGTRHMSPGSISSVFRSVYCSSISTCVLLTRSSTRKQLCCVSPGSTSHLVTSRLAVCTRLTCCTARRQCSAPASPLYCSWRLRLCSEVSTGPQLPPEPALVQLARLGWPVGAGVVRLLRTLLLAREKFHLLSLAELRLSSSCLRVAVSTSPVISSATCSSPPGASGRLEAMVWVCTVTRGGGLPGASPKLYSTSSSPTGFTPTFLTVSLKWSVSPL